MIEQNSEAESPASGSEEGARITSRVIDLDEVMRRTTLSRSTIYDWMEKGLFPRSIELGPRRVGWLESDIEAWIAQRAAASHAARARPGRRRNPPFESSSSFTQPAVPSAPGAASPPAPSPGGAGR